MNFAAPRDRLRSGRKLTTSKHTPSFVLEVLKARKLPPSLFKNTETFVIKSECWTFAVWTEAVDYLGAVVML